MRLAVDATGEPADDHQTRRRQLAARASARPERRRRSSSGRRRSRPNGRDEKLGRALAGTDWRRDRELARAAPDTPCFVGTSETAVTPRPRAPSGPVGQSLCDVRRRHFDVSGERGDRPCHPARRVTGPARREEACRPHARGARAAAGSNRARFAARRPPHSRPAHRTSADDSPRPCRAPAQGRAERWTTRSKRSSSARESFSR